ncbi:MAG: radical SAM protein [Alphaproteobacteria bacterium]
MIAEAQSGDFAPDDADAWFHMFHRSLGVHLTMRCPLRCAHCSVHSGPERHETVDGPLLLSRLEEMGREGSVKRLCLSGGEPFLVRTLLMDILEIAERHGIVTIINTAAHWAGTPQRARNTLRDIPDGVHIAVSADQYHTEFVPIDNVRNALQASLERGLFTALVLRAWDGESDPFTHELRAFLGEELWSSVKLDIDVIKHVGRGEDLPRRTPQAPVSPGDIRAGYCDFADQPVVDSDNTVLACCNTQGARGAPHLHLGHLESDSVTGITEKADRDLILQAIRVWGPAALRDLLKEGGLGHRLAAAYPDDSICHLCTDICSKPDLVEYLQRRLNEPDLYAELAASRLLRYGESFPDLETREELERA